MAKRKHEIAQRYCALTIKAKKAAAVGTKVLARLLYVALSPPFTYSGRRRRKASERMKGKRGTERQDKTFFIIKFSCFCHGRRKWSQPLLQRR
jgi:hypothetical protein